MKRGALVLVPLAIGLALPAAAQPVPELPPPPPSAPEAPPDATPAPPAAQPLPPPPIATPTPAPAAAREDTENPTRPLYAGSRKNFRFRGGISYAQTKLYTVPIQMGDFELHVGGPTRERSLVFFVSAHQAIGRTQQGLHVWNTSGGFTLELDANYVQVGLELRTSMLIVERATRDASMVTFGLGGRPYVAVTLVPIDDESALQLVAGLGIDAFGGSDATTNITPSLGLGFRY